MQKQTAPPPVKCLRIALIGYGSVGQALVEMLRDRADDLAHSHRVRFDIACVFTRRKGFAASAQQSGALAYDWLIDVYQRGDYAPLTQQPLPTMQALQRQYGVDIVIETTPAVYATGEPALSLAEAALSAGMHLVTANKAVVVHGYGDRLRAWGSARAADAGLPLFLFESAVMDGVPIFNLAKYGLGGARITGFRGVLNSTCNFILTRMEATRCSLEEALAMCQQLGITETDPTGDIDGHDSQVKTCALASVLLKANSLARGLMPNAADNHLDDTDNLGHPKTASSATHHPSSATHHQSSQALGGSIRAVTLAQIDDAKNLRGTRLKVVCEALFNESNSPQERAANIAEKKREHEQGEGQDQKQERAPERGFDLGPEPHTTLDLSVKLVEVTADNVFYHLAGASSAIEIYTQELAPICITSTEPTTSDTAFGVLADCLEIAASVGCR